MKIKKIYIKVILGLLLLLAVFCLTGCDSNIDDVDKILNILKDKGIVEKDLILVDKQIETYTTLFITKSTYYIYKDGDSNLIAINYNTNLSSQNDYKYYVMVYNDVDIEEVEYIDDYYNLASYYSYQNGKTSKTGKYDCKNYKKYEIYEKNKTFNLLFFSISLGSEYDIIEEK